MSIGYACLAVGVAHTDQRSCLKKNAGDETLEVSIWNILYKYYGNRCLFLSY